MRMGLQSNGSTSDIGTNGPSGFAASENDVSGLVLAINKEPAERSLAKGSQKKRSESQSALEQSSNQNSQNKSSTMGT